MGRTPKIKGQQKLAEKELAGYRQWITELEEEARQTGGDLTLCDGEVWQYFDPGKPLGYQIYRSYSDEELLDILIKTMNHQGRTPDYS